MKHAELAGWAERVWLEAAVRCEPVIRISKKACRAAVQGQVRAIVRSPRTKPGGVALDLLRSRCAACGRCKVPPL